MEQNRQGVDLRRIQRSWEKCLEALGISEAQSFEIAGMYSAPSLLHLIPNEIFKLLKTFNLSQDLLERDQVCLNTLARQFRGDVAFSQRALGNQGSRPEVILFMEACLTDYQFDEILASFQLSRKLVSQSNSYMSAEIVDTLSTRICNNKFGHLWIEELAAQNCRKFFGKFKGNAKSFSNFMDYQINAVERNFSYQIESSNDRKIVFSCQTNENSRDYFGRNIEGHAWLENIKYFCQAYFDHSAEVNLIYSTLKGADRNLFEIDFY